VVIDPEITLEAIAEEADRRERRERIKDRVAIVIAALITLGALFFMFRDVVVSWRSWPGVM
jgi:hypothetical protein